jgi:hypothetical protein
VAASEPPEANRAGGAIAAKRDGQHPINPSAVDVMVDDGGAVSGQDPHAVGVGLDTVVT